MRGGVMVFGVATRRRGRRGRSQDEVTARAGVRGAGGAVLDGGRCGEQWRVLHVGAVHA